jgi:RHS repeat-associated protein
MLRLWCLLQDIFGDSDREVIENNRMHNSLKNFLELAVNEEVPDDTTISYFRTQRLCEAKFREVFEQIVQQCKDKGLVTSMYNALNRLTGKIYPAGSNTNNVRYTYDSGANSKGRRTSMNDYVSTPSISANYSYSYQYDTRRRLTQESLTIDSINYTTGYSYDGLDRLYQITYPTGEVVTQQYNSRGLPSSLSGTQAGSLVTSAGYNNLGSITQINLGNGLTTNYGYYGYSGTYDNTGGYYGRLYKIKTGSLQDMQYTWDAAGNLTRRHNPLINESETFNYDYLDRLSADGGLAAVDSPGDANRDGRITSADGTYVMYVIMGYYTATPGCDANGDSTINMGDVNCIENMIINQGYQYDALGNITSKNGISYSYNSSKPHAVTQVGNTSYDYDANGNMTHRGSQTITYDVENRPITITGGAAFVYDGDGNRIKKTEGWQTTLYINLYYEKNLTASEVTTYYYFGGKLIAQRKAGTLRYIHQDSLGSTSVISDSSGISSGTMRYFPFGSTRFTTGTIPTDEKFTGQRLDSTGLYYYNARYYDPGIGRFISPDIFTQWSTGFDVVSQSLTVNIIPMGLGRLMAPFVNYPKTTPQTPVNPQTLNRYSYVLNNPLQYSDPNGWFTVMFSLSYGGTVLAARGSNTYGLIMDNHGNWAILDSTSASIVFKDQYNFGLSINITGGVQYTTAETIWDLFGGPKPLVVSVSYGEGPMGSGNIVMEDSGIIGGGLSAGFGYGWSASASYGLNSQILVSNRSLSRLGYDGLMYYLYLTGEIDIDTYIYYLSQPDPCTAIINIFLGDPNQGLSDSQDNQ